jgi:uncharacterized membrane protein
MLTGKIMSSGFIFALVGTLVSISAMSLIYRIRFFSPIGVSSLGAFLHIFSQIIVASLLFFPGLHLYALVPLLGSLSLISGAFMGYISIS